MILRTSSEFHSAAVELLSITNDNINNTKTNCFRCVVDEETGLRLLPLKTPEEEETEKDSKITTITEHVTMTTTSTSSKTKTK